MKRIAIVLVAGVAVVSVLLALAVVLGAPQPPPPMESINAPFRSVDFSDLSQPFRYHPVQHFTGACFCVDGRSATVLNAHLLLCLSNKLSTP